MCRLMKRILGYLIPARAIVGVPLREVEYGDGHQLADEDLFMITELFDNRHTKSYFLSF